MIPWWMYCHSFFSQTCTSLNIFYKYLSFLLLPLWCCVLLLGELMCFVKTFTSTSELFIITLILWASSSHILAISVKNTNTITRPKPYFVLLLDKTASITVLFTPSQNGVTQLIRCKMEMTCLCSISVRRNKCNIIYNKL